MSLDYPFYEELRRRRHPAAKWWRIGDALYYLGLLPGLMLVIPALFALVKLGLGSGFSKSQIWVLGIFTTCAVLFLLGMLLKRKAWNMALKDGIRVDDF